MPRAAQTACFAALCLPQAAQSALFFLQNVESRGWPNVRVLQHSMGRLAKCASFYDKSRGRAPRSGKRRKTRIVPAPPPNESFAATKAHATNTAPDWKASGVRSGQARPGQVRSGQVRPGQVRSGQVEVRSGQVRLRSGEGQVRSGQVRLRSASSQVKVSFWSG